MTAHTIDEVLQALDDISGAAIQQRDRVGYFAALYRNVTAGVRDAVVAGEFADGPRMDRLDVAFANRYIEALDAYRRGAALTDSWRVTFTACQSDEPTILQHLYGGLAAHLLLDLGIGAAEVAPGDRIDDLYADFDHVNEIVGRLMTTIDERVGQLSPLVGLIDRTAGMPYASINRLSIFVARRMAWRFAKKLAPLGPQERAERIRSRDKLTARVATTILQPRGLPGLVARIVRARESNDVARNIQVLRG